MAGSFLNSLELELKKMCFANSNCNKDSDTSVTSKHLRHQVDENIQRKMFEEQRQQDASEFLICWINALQVYQKRLICEVYSTWTSKPR